MDSSGGRYGLLTAPTAVLNELLGLARYSDRANALWPHAVWRRGQSDELSPPNAPAGYSAASGSPTPAYAVAPAPDNGQIQLAAASQPGFWDHWSIRGCQNCHGYTPGTLPPVPGQAPPWGTSWYSHGYSGGGFSAPDDRKQCEMQLNSDGGICAQQPTAKAGAVCRKTASDRWKHCLRTGELDDPTLFRARRKDGRYWP